jgi:hypothetical protein
MNKVSPLFLLSTIACALMPERERKAAGFASFDEMLDGNPDPVTTRQERRTEVIIGNLRTRLTDAECRTLGVDPDDRCIGRMLAKCACGAQLDSADERYRGLSRKAAWLAAGWGVHGKQCPKCRAAKEANRG